MSQPSRRASAPLDIDAACAGDREAVAALVEAFLPRIFGLCHRLVGRRELAEEAAQETFVRALRALPELRDRERVASWLLTIAANTARELGRKAARETPLSIEPPVEDAPRDEEEEAVRSRALARAVATLDHDDRELLLLHKIEGLHLRELAAMRDTSLPAMKSRVHRIQAKVRVAAFEALERERRRA